MYIRCVLIQHTENETEMVTSCLILTWLLLFNFVKPEDFIPKHVWNISKVRYLSTPDWIKYNEKLLEKYLSVFSWSSFVSSQLLSSLAFVARKLSMFTCKETTEIKKVHWFKPLLIKKPIIVFKMPTLTLTGNALNWHFEIHTTFRLNMSFRILKVISDCRSHKFGFLQIRAISDSHQIYFNFCGIHANFSVFPPTNFICTKFVTLRRYDKKMIAIDSVFMVMSSDLIESISATTAHPLLLAALHVLHMSLQIHTLRLQVQKHKKLHLVIQESYKHVVFDGPGTKSTKLAAVDNKYRCSTFQCILLLMTEGKQNSLCCDQAVSYTSTNVPVTNFLYQTHKVPLYTQVFEVFRVSAPENYSVNLTISEFLFQGMQSLSCTFGGIVILDYVTASVSKGNATMSLCNKGTHEKRVFIPEQQHVYGGNLMYIIVFSYERYSGVEVTLAANYTSCKTLSIHPCMYKKNKFKIPKLDINLGSGVCYVLDVSTNRHQQTTPWKYLFCNLACHIEGPAGNPHVLDVTVSGFHQTPVFVFDSAVQYHTTGVLVSHQHKPTQSKTKFSFRKRSYKSGMDYTTSNESGISYYKQFLLQVPSWEDQQIYFDVIKFSYQFLEVAIFKTNISIQSIRTNSTHSDLFYRMDFLATISEILLISLSGENRNRSNFKMKFVSQYNDDPTVKATKVYTFAAHFSLAFSLHQHRKQFMLAVLGDFTDPQIYLSGSEKKREILIDLIRLPFELPQRPQLMDNVSVLHQLDGKILHIIKLTKQRKYHFIQNFLDLEYQPLSWAKVQNICYSFEEHLPVFNSRTEQEDFIAILKGNLGTFVDAVYVSFER